MKKNYLKIAAAAAFAAAVATGCGSGKQIAGTSAGTSTGAATPNQPSSGTQKKIQEMQDEAALLEAQAKLDAVKRKTEMEAAMAATEMPCQQFDDDEWFYATGTRQFKAGNINTAPTALLRSTQLQMRQKLAGVYKAVTRDYFDQMSTDEGSYANEHIESAGDLVVRAKVNETYEVCRRQSAPDANNNITMYMAIKVSKKQFVDDVVKEISKDKQMEIRFNEKQFRDSAFKVFEDSNKEEFNKFKESQQ
ncbi:MAG: hypothetical protein LBL94_03700 [Prevotellaceae bacterium]|jgi:hypothetical protein|nr:hypothetical protein [Prevotellaceae bacterium]